MAPFSIAGRAIGVQGPPFLIAEAGVNHNGRRDLALRLVDAAADAGADAVKFQTFNASLLATTSAPSAEYQQRGGPTTSQRDLLQALELPVDALRAAFARAAERGITAFSTPFDVGSVRLLTDLGVPCLKIGSGDLTDIFLLRSAASTRTPLILSTGMATLEELDAAVSVIRDAGDPPLAVLHCLSAYPAPPAEVNLRAIPILRERYGVEVGFSDHTIGSATAIAAVALGAVIVEKHLTVDRSLPGPDHAASMEPSQLADLAHQLREAHASLGSAEKGPQPSEMDTRRVARRSLVLKEAGRAGSVLGVDDMDAKRPADGISPLRLDEVVGRRLVRDLPAEATLRPEDLDPPLRPSQALDG